jgi:hypothetical protein
LKPVPNRLAGATSPYLRQHAHNPVDWHPWGEEAFARARAEDKPIFLSIGYATCHWCHVMARASFENPAIAEQLNRDFVAIKVDREERPDVDRVYMNYVQSLTGHGGWPLSAFLTPDLKPFYGGTYFPPEDRLGRPGFASLLRTLADSWRRDRPRLLQDSDRVIESLAQSRAATATASNGSDPTRAIFDSASDAFEKGFHALYQGFDRDHGGFGGAPKFPRGSNLNFLLRCAALQGLSSEAGQEAVNLCGYTLQQMAGGGIHDHVGGGFHRYSVDAEWFLPHFEKMLYDQAQIAVNAIETWQATKDERMAWLARDIFDYVLREMTGPGGGFYSAEDADSDVPGLGHAEGAFYVWTAEEISAALPPEQAALVIRHFGVRPEGNVPEERDPFKEFTGKNVLVQTASLGDTAAALGISPPVASDRLVAALERLRAVRAARPRPLRDDKVIAAWNGMMISALARGASAPSEALADQRARLRAAAVRAAEFLGQELWDESTGDLYRSWCGQRGTARGFAEDYASVIQGLLDLYEATFEVRWLQWADRLQDRMDVLFYDELNGGYFSSAAGATDIIVRIKDDYDGAEPTASSVAAMNLFRLATMLGGGDARRARALRTLEAFRTRWSEFPQALPQMLCSIELALGAPRQVVLAGAPGTAEFVALAEVLRERLGPYRAVVAADGGAGQAWLAERAPWIAEMRPVDGKATAYVCEDYRCQSPAISRDELARLLAV